MLLVIRSPTCTVNKIRCLVKEIIVCLDKRRYHSSVLVLGNLQTTVSVSIPGGPSRFLFCKQSPLDVFLSFLEVSSCVCSCVFPCVRALAPLHGSLTDEALGAIVQNIQTNIRLSTVDPDISEEDLATLMTESAIGQVQIYDWLGSGHCLALLSIHKINVGW